MRNVKNLSLCVLLLALVSTATGTTLYVPGDSYPYYPTIQAAIDAAALSGDQIEVAAGTYLEAINFNGKAIRLYSSGGPTVTTIDATDIVASVVTCRNGEGSGTILEGFTITGGSGTGAELHCNGGGMYNFDSSPTVTNCIFSSNTASGRGGGMCNYGQSVGSNPTVTNCTFSDNYGHWGGGMNNTNSSPTVTNCNFIGNTASGGGGMLNESSSNSIVTNCKFISNGSSLRGGGMMNSNDSSPTVTNCTFSKNSAYYTGGGMSNEGGYDGSNSIVTNCTFSDNTAGAYGGMHNEKSNPTVTNCIFWGDTLPEIADALSAASTVTYSDVQNGTGEDWFGEGCIDVDPMFADADGRLLAGSPCIDAGDDSVVVVTTDLDGNPRIQGARVDMGAFEATPATPDAMLAGLRAYIVEQVGLGIDAEMDVCLLAKVDAAISALDRGNANDAKVAMNDLKALINQVGAQTDKKITPDVAKDIIDRANAIIAALGG